jgi:hypothetical protein
MKEGPGGCRNTQSEGEVESGPYVFCVKVIPDTIAFFDRDDAGTPDLPLCAVPAMQIRHTRATAINTFFTFMSILLSQSVTYRCRTAMMISPLSISSFVLTVAEFDFERGGKALSV